MNFSNDKKNIDLENLDLTLKLKSSDGAGDIFGNLSKYCENAIKKEKGLTFSDDVNKFNEDVNNFINYVKQNISDKNIGFMFLERNDNIISYGKKYKGIVVERIAIDMISNDDLRNIYELIKKEFNSSYDLYFKNDFLYGWQLGISINDELNIDFDSSSSYDNLWIREEREKYFDSSVRKR